MPILAVVLLASAPASPRDELLRLAPPDAALVAVVQNARDHARGVAASPFGRWFPSTPIGRRVMASDEVRQFREAAAVISAELGTTPDIFLDDVIGDAVAFAYSPGPPGRPDDERAVILIRPRRPDVLAKLIDTLNALQTKSGELTGVGRKEHKGAVYHERKKAGGGADFYCFRGGVFAFSGAEADITAAIDRDADHPGQTPELVSRLKRLGVADAAAVLLVNPRPFDAEVKARVAAAKPDEKRFLERFAEVWAALDAAAVYAHLDADLELGLALRFRPAEVPADLRPWLVGPRKWGTPAAVIPANALFGFAAHARATELIDLVASLAPAEPGNPGVKEWLRQTVGPVVGRDNLPLVLNALGPDWAVWAEPPATDALLPTFVAAVRLSGDGEDRAAAEAGLVQALDAGFLMARLAYNATHADQIELKEEKDAATGATVKSLVNPKGFPPGFRPSFAVVKGYLVLATTPEAVTRFAPPPEKSAAAGSVTVATFSGGRAREYLRAHGPKLAAFLAGLGGDDEKKVRGDLETIAEMLELVDSADLTLRDLDDGLKLVLRVKPAKPLK
jgi:hypothetical protein